jgi:hypothetical protein
MTHSVRERIERPTDTVLAALEPKLASGRRVIVQYSEPPYPSDVLTELNRLAHRYGDLLEIRFYGHHGSSFDCRTLEQVSSVRSLSLDCLGRADNLLQLASLDRLERLSLGVFDMTSDEVLAADNLRGLKELTLGETRKRVVDLSVLESYSRLELLRICGHARNIGVVGGLHTVRDLWLNSIPKAASIEFTSRMRGLRSLHVILGGRPSLAGVCVQGLEALEVVRVRGLTDLGNLGRFPALALLKIEDQIQLEQITFSAANSALEGVHLYNCKSLRALPGLEQLPRLRELRIFRTALEPSSVRRDRLARSLEAIAFGTGKANLDRKIRADRASLGYAGPHKDDDAIAIDWRST